MTASAAVAIAAVYEWGFWAIVGVAAATGVSNLGLKGSGLLDATTTWGAALGVKLTIVLVVLSIALIRSDFVVRCAAASVVTARSRTVLVVLYAATTAALFAAQWIGLGLAHGRY